jgi:uncharacterized protein GlcG (DUF336 family)
MKKTLIALSISSVALCSTPSYATDVLTQKNIGLDLANEIAMLSTKKCRDEGYQVSSVVVDKHGNVRSAVRDDLAARFTLEIAERKANMVIMSGIDSGTFRKSREDIRLELNHMQGLIVMEGGLPVQAAGALIGAIGVSGAPGGDKDAACAKHAIEEMAERLEFAD